MRRYVPLLLLLTTLGCARAVPVAPKVAVATKAPVADVIRQGLNNADRAGFYHLSMGSELVPLAWLKALESETTGKLFLEDIDRFGLLSDPENADGLPVGFSVAMSKDARAPMRMVGLNCAACHTGELTCFVKKRGTLAIRIDGGSSLFDAEAFTKDLIGSLVGTFKSPEKLLAFLKRQADDRLAAERPAAHRFLNQCSSLTDLSKVGACEKRLAERFESMVQSEWQRVSAALEAGLDFDKEKAKLGDLVGSIEHGDLADWLTVNPVAGGPLAHLAAKDDRATGLRQILDHLAVNIRMLKARIDFAKKVLAEQKLHLANTAGGPGRVDDFGAARNLLFDAKYAQAMNAPCSVPHLWGTPKFKWTNWDGSTQSTMARSVATALAGGAVFDPKTYRSTVLVRNLGKLEAIASKITLPVWPVDVFGAVDPNKVEKGRKLFQKHCAKCHGPEAAADVIVDLKELGTDPNRLHNYARPLGDGHFSAAVQAETAKYLNQACKDDGVTAEELEAMRDGHANVWRNTAGYAARPLVAIWATPPYLHNGSVPTIADLLKPAKDRPKTFLLGHRDYDPIKLGYAATGAPARFTFDTSLPGNSNSGHEYGTQLSDVQRGELIEYLKSN